MRTGPTIAGSVGPAQRIDRCCPNTPNYMLVKRMRIDLAALFETKGWYWYWQGVNPVAVTWNALGFIAYMFVIPAEWIRVLITLLATGAGYWATMYLLGPYIPRSPAPRIRASKPSRSRISIGSSR
jgi:hypothetical protein